MFSKFYLVEVYQRKLLPKPQIGSCPIDILIYYCRLIICSENVSFESSMLQCDIQCFSALYCVSFR